jgi:methyltransferase (TIGR00027 family)
MNDLEDVSDTALWVATFRAKESARKDALFRDPLAALLVGEEGPRVVRSLGFHGRIGGGVVVRTVAFDDFVRTSLKEGGVDAVINLGAGLDTRPYRMDLPPSLHWWELDLPRILDFKEARLAKEKPPRCNLRRIRVDLRDGAARRRVLDELAAQTHRALILSEGVLAYLEPLDVVALGSELRSFPSFRFWAADLVAHTLLDWSRHKAVGRRLEQAGAQFRFAPKEGVDFFKPLGWRVLDVRNPIVDGFRLRRLPLFMRILKPLILRKPREASHMAAWAKAGNILLERDDVEQGLHSSS